MSMSGIVATAISQWRQGLINCISNKVDPFNAITCCMAMLATIPKEHRPKDNEMQNKPPKKKDYMEDPDGHDYEEMAWKYVRELVIKAEESGARYISNLLTNARS